MTVISDARSRQLLQLGAEVLPTQWIEVDRNEKERTVFYDSKAMIELSQK